LKTISVNTSSKLYSVYIGNKIFKSLPEIFRKSDLPLRTFVVIDKKVDRIYGTSIRKIINNFSDKTYFLQLESSEKIKSLTTANQIYSELLKNNFGRDTVIISFGGGTISDLVGFAASTFMRGVYLVHIPTTLLSAVDSCVGGKTGVNLKGIKNTIGTFYQPEFVLIDTNFMSSLPREEVISGFGEVIKYSYLTDKKFYTKLHSNYELVLKKSPVFLNEIIYFSVKIKSAIVSKDEKEETGLRKILNFGHTFAHALESNSMYKLSHGKAVVLGIICALKLSYEKKLINEKQLNYMLKLPLRFKSSINIKKMKGEALLSKMSFDKKSSAGKIQFILLKNFGEILVDIPADNKSILNSIKDTEQIWFKRATAGL